MVDGVMCLENNKVQLIIARTESHPRNLRATHAPQ